MKIHGITTYSQVNGPGVRTVIHFQGCKFQCPGCFNPETHSLAGGAEMTLEQVLDKIPPDIEGVTISGGEPFLQQEALLKLVTILQELNYSVVIFSGFYRSEIEGLKLGKQILSHIDVLIDGRFEENMVSSQGMHGSDNQNIHLFSDRYKVEDFEKREVELSFDVSGSTRITGFPSSDLLQLIKEC
jgi:anaerobic ribonucleoside-triphosphate reductase activating protein